VTRHVLWLALAGLAVAGCESGPARSKPQVVATVYPLWEFSRQVAGARADSIVLVPPGVEPHDWEPSPRDVSLAQRATVFVHSGTGLDAWSQKLLIDGKSQRVVVDVSHGLPLIQTEGVIDPHIWLDPVRPVVRPTRPTPAPISPGSTRSVRPSAPASVSAPGATW
jgi:zinc transport system substrate-binding protein